MSSDQAHILDELRDLETRAARLRVQLSQIVQDESTISQVELIDEQTRLDVYDLVVDHLSEAVLVVSEHGALVDANKTARELFGLSRRRFGLIHFSEVLGEAYKQLDPKLFERLKSEIAIGLELELSARGESFFAELLLVYVEGTHASYSVVLIRDVTDRKSAEQAFQLSSGQLQAVLSAIPDLTFRLDAQGTYLDIRAKKSQVLGRDKNELIGQTIHDLLPAELANSIQEKITLTLRTQQVHSFEYALTTSSNVVEQFEAWMAPVHGNEVLSIVRNVTEIKRFESVREDLIQRLEEKNQELQQFTYRISHDLKNPLVSIKGFAQLLSEDLDEGMTDDLQDHLTEIITAAEKMQFLIDQILDLSRLGSATVELEPLDMNEVIEFAIRQEAGQIQKAGAQIDVTPQLPQAIGDFHQLSTVFQNLIDNACKYCNEPDAPRIRIGADVVDGRAVWYVQDNGVGIEPHNQQKVFDLFQRVDRRVKGSGVGLALVKRIIEIHGGKIWVESEGAGQGTTFHFTLDQETEWEDFEKMSRV